MQSPWHSNTSIPWWEPQARRSNFNSIPEAAISGCLDQVLVTRAPRVAWAEVVRAHAFLYLPWCNLLEFALMQCIKERVTHFCCGSPVMNPARGEQRVARQSSCAGDHSLHRPVHCQSGCNVAAKACARPTCTFNLSLLPSTASRARIDRALHQLLFFFFSALWTPRQSEDV